MVVVPFRKLSHSLGLGVYQITSFLCTPSQVDLSLGYHSSPETVLALPPPSRLMPVQCLSKETKGSVLFISSIKPGCLRWLYSLYLHPISNHHTFSRSVHPGPPRAASHDEIAHPRLSLLLVHCSCTSKTAVCRLALYVPRAKSRGGQKL